MPKPGDLLDTRGLSLNEILKIKGGFVKVVEIRPPYVTLKVLLPKEIRAINFAAQREHDEREKITAKLRRTNKGG